MSKVQILNEVNRLDDNHQSATSDLTTILSTSTISFESWQYDSTKNEEKCCSDAYEYVEFETDEEEDELSIPEIEDVISEKELSWNDPDELDELDEINGQENTDIQYINEVKITGKLNRYEKAKKIATEVIQTYHWGKENISLLEQVFVENGWGMTRVSIERELSKGLIPEELALALFIRQLWTENQQYWISFIHITSNQPGQEAKPIYKNMSWAESLRIIRSFNNRPSEEELQIFIYQIYDDWYCSTILQRQHKAFFKYLKYCTDSKRNLLPEDAIFSFVDSYYKESL